MWYTVNASGPAVDRLQSPNHGCPAPTSNPLQPHKPVVVFIHVTPASSDIWLGQVRDSVGGACSDRLEADPLATEQLSSDPRMRKAFNLV